MDNIAYLSLSQAAMLQRASDITANNIANASTAGFRAAKVSFGEMVVDTGSKDAMAPMSYALDRGTYTDVSQGAMTPTGNPLDIAVQGTGWLAYERLDGQTALGRDGNLTVNAEGDLVTSAGHRVLDIGGAPINIPLEAGAVSIARDGTIAGADGEVIGRIGVFDSPEASDWKRLDGGMLAPREGVPALVPALDSTISQGFVEGSNSNPVLDMTTMISQQRAFERAMNVAQKADELRGQSLQRLGRQP